MTSTKRSLVWASACVSALLAAGAARAQCPIPAQDFTPDPAFASDFLLEQCRFATKGENPFLPLRPGWQVVLESDEELSRVTVLHDTRWVDGVRTRVVEEFEYEKDGEELVPVERSLNFLAYCRETGSIAYFGEDVFFFDDEGNPIPGAGGWLAGQNGARPGLLMPGTILVGGGYYQEIAPEDSALDKGRIAALEASCEAGDFQLGPCVRIVDTTDCEPGAEDEKVFAAGIGNVVDEDLELTSFGFVSGRRDHRHDDDDHDD